MVRKDSINGSVSDTAYFPEARTQPKKSSSIPADTDGVDEIDSCMSPEQLAVLEECVERNKEALRLLSE